MSVFLIVGCQQKSVQEPPPVHTQQRTSEVRTEAPGTFLSLALLPFDAKFPVDTEYTGGTASKRIGFKDPDNGQYWMVLSDPVPDSGLTLTEFLRRMCSQTENWKIWGATDEPKFEIVNEFDSMDVHMILIAHMCTLERPRHISESEPAIVLAWNDHYYVAEAANGTDIWQLKAVLENLYPVGTK